MLYGGISNDSLSFSTDLYSSTVWGGEAGGIAGDSNDTLYVSGTVSGSLINGNAGDDSLFVEGELISSKIQGGSGNDRITTSTSISLSTVGGSLGKDTIELSNVIGSSVY